MKRDMSTDIIRIEGVHSGPEGVAPASSRSLARLSKAESEKALELVQQCMASAGVHSVYELFLSTELKRSTLYRWFADAEVGRVTELPISAVRALADALALGGDPEGPMRELASLLDSAESRETLNAKLIAEFRVRRVSYWRALAAIRAAGHRLVPVDESAEK